MHAEPARPSPGRLRLWTSPRLDDARFMRRVWVASRLLLFLEWVLMRFSLGDTRYYFAKISELGTVGPRLTMQEYPTPVLWLLRLPWLVSGGQRWAYVLCFWLLMMLLDAAFTRTLWRDGGRLRGQAVVFWCAFVPVVGITAYLRFDIVTAVLAGWALLALRRRRPLQAGVLVGLGAAVKLWPAFLLPALLADGQRPGAGRRRVRATLGLVLAGVVTAGASLLWAGWDRLLSPLGWQSERGLQIESVWATVPMVLRLFHPHRYWVAISEFNAWEVSGPTTSLFLRLAGLSFDLGLLLAVVAYLLWLRRPGQRLVQGAALMLLVVLVVIVTNKTFSPQYIIWMGGPLAAGWAIASEEPAGSAPALDDERRLATTSEWTLLLTLFTQLVYPVSYAALVGHMPGMPVATAILVVRNLMLVWVLVKVAAWTWSFVRPGHHPRTTQSADATTREAGPTP